MASSLLATNVSGCQQCADTDRKVFQERTHEIRWIRAFKWFCSLLVVMIVAAFVMFILAVPTDGDVWNPYHIAVGISFWIAIVAGYVLFSGMLGRTVYCFLHYSPEGKCTYMHQHEADPLKTLKIGTFLRHPQYHDWGDYLRENPILKVRVYPFFLGSAFVHSGYYRDFTWRIARAWNGETICFRDRFGSVIRVYGDPAVDQGKFGFVQVLIYMRDHRQVNFEMKRLLHVSQEDAISSPN